MRAIDLYAAKNPRRDIRATSAAYGESTDGMESDDADLQPQTSVEPGELREIDASSGSKSPAKRLKLGRHALFSIRRRGNRSGRLSVRTESLENKNRRSELSDRRSNFFSAHHSPRAVVFTQPRALFG